MVDSRKADVQSVKDNGTFMSDLTSLMSKMKEVIEKLPDSKMLDAPGSGFTRIENVKGISNDFLAEYKRLSVTMGVNPPPKIYVTKDSEIGANITKDGKPVIFISEEDLKKPPKELLFLLSHEIEHVKKGDVSLQSQIKLADMTDAQRKKQSIQDEFKADKGAAVFCDPSIGSAALKNMFDKETLQKVREAGRSINGGNLLTEEQARDLVENFIERNKGRDHPRTNERIKELDALPKNTPGCFTPSIQSASVIDEV